MSESASGENGGAGTGGGAGCVVAAAVVGGVLLLGALAAVVLLFLAAKYTAEAVPDKTLTAPPPPSVAPAPPAEVCAVRLTGVGDGGTWYTVDEEIHEGDEALGEAVRELAAEAKRTGKGLTVRLEVQPDAGVTARHVRAAAEACRAAGAEVEMPGKASGGSATPGKGAGEEGE
ncbi:MAG: hypothetical protein ACYTGB_03945 [Planctomycetota bacterium]|jgi:hypothetical protein